MPDRTYLHPIDPELMPGARNAVEVCLRLKPEERITIITDTATRQTTALAKLPLGGMVLELVTCKLEGTGAVVTTLEYGPLGSTTASVATNVWFALGQGPSRRYLPLRVDPVTGLVEPGALTAIDPITGAVASGS